jgi:hypothetical protein
MTREHIKLASEYTGLDWSDLTNPDYHEQVAPLAVNRVFARKIAAEPKGGWKVDRDEAACELASVGHDPGGFKTELDSLFGNGFRYLDLDACRMLREILGQPRRKPIAFAVGVIS